MSMNIYALPGHKVKVTEKTKIAGTSQDVANVKNWLILEKEYTVESTNVRGYSTSVTLVRFEGMRFNSVNFEDVVMQTPAQDKKHPDWKKYHS